MKLRSKPGELAEPFGLIEIAKVEKTKKVVKNRVSNYSKGILKKYRKQRQQKQAIANGAKNLASNGDRKWMPSPIKPRMTRSAALKNGAFSHTEIAVTGV